MFNPVTMLTPKFEMAQQRASPISVGSICDSQGLNPVKILFSFSIKHHELSCLSKNICTVNKSR